jgi:hypothetical protein
MWRVLAILPLCAACGFNPSSSNPGDDDDGPPPADARDGDVGEETPPDARVCFGEGNYEVCLQAITPLPPLDLPATLSTDAAPCLTPVPASFWAKTTGQPDSCVIVAESIQVPATTTVTGSRPLVLVATGTITIAGALDLSSRQGIVELGPAANWGLCPAPTPPGGAAAGGGGPGGSFQFAGGNGGNGNAGTGSTASPEVTAPNILRGGCSGTKGAGLLVGEAGASGGVAYLVAAVSIQVTGSINASGAGADAGGVLAGGSGGGSGGMIVLWAPAIDASGRIVANGGGGSAGGDNNTVGDAGNDPDPSTPNVQPDGGNPGGRGGGGGKGYAAPAAATSGGIGNSLEEAGGGGGGGGGFIRSNQPLTGVISPPAVP